MENGMISQTAAVNPDPGEMEERAAGIARRVAEGVTTLQEELGLDERALEAVYALAFNLYEQGKYEDARKIFGFLLILNPLVHKYWFGLASVCRMAGDRERAAAGYFLSTMTDAGRPEPYLYLAECLAALGDREGAAETLKKAVAAAETAGSARIGRRAAIMLEALERNGREEG